MRRGITFLICVVLTGCTPGTTEDPDPEVVASADPSTPEASAPPQPIETLDVTEACPGFGRAPGRGQITITEDDELRAYAPEGGRPQCLVDLEELGVVAGNLTAPSWNATADRVLLAGHGISADGSVTPRLARKDRPVEWSRPTGTSVVFVSPRGELKKSSSAGGRARTISFLERHDDVTYHPAGLHVASSGRSESGEYGIFLATNLGTEPKLLARGEKAQFINQLEFSDDGRWLYFTARHGSDDWHLHRLSITRGPGLETLATAAVDFGYAVSPFDSDRYAWFVPGDCAAGRSGDFEISRKAFQIPPGFDARNVHPVGWLRNGLVVRAATTGCSTAQPGDVYVLTQRDPVLVAEDNYGAVSVRVVRPPPPPPPGDEPEVVA